MTVENEDGCEPLLLSSKSGVAKVKKATILSGVSGTGKTHYRKRNLAKLPFLDISDFYHNKDTLYFDWLKVYRKFFDTLDTLLSEHDEVVIEGYFLPGTPTREMLLNFLENREVEVEIRTFWAPYSECTKRIRLQYEKLEINKQQYQRRLKALKECYHLAVQA